MQTRKNGQCNKGFYKTLNQPTKHYLEKFKKFRKPKKHPNKSELIEISEFVKEVEFNIFKIKNFFSFCIM